MADEEQTIISRFKGRRDNALERIKRKIRDPEQSHIQFLILYEIPYIFLEGKAIAGFVSNRPTENASLSSQPTDALIDQPLNTLHLTERVIEKDHFEDLLTQIEVSLDSGDEISEVNVNQEISPLILSYLGVTEAEKEVFTSPIYLLKLRWNDDSSFVVLFKYRPLGESDLSQFKDQLRSFLDSCLQLSKENTATEFPRPLCRKASPKPPLASSLRLDCMEDLLDDRTCLDQTLDHVNSTMKRIIGDPKKDTGGFSSVFFRSGRPDVNYLRIQLTYDVCDYFKSRLLRISSDTFKKEFVIKALSYQKAIMQEVVSGFGQWKNYIAYPDLIDSFIVQFNLIGKAK